MTSHQVAVNLVIFALGLSIPTTVRDLPEAWRRGSRIDLTLVGINFVAVASAAVAAVCWL